MSDRDRLRQLMMAALDGEIDEADRRELERGLACDGEIRAEWEALNEVKDITASLKFREPPREVWGDYWQSVFRRAERGFGWLLLASGAAVLGGYGLWRVVSFLATDGGLPWWLRAALAALLVGGAVLLASVVREKWFVARHDPYREIER